jgi:hypothetical protein
MSKTRIRRLTQNEKYLKDAAGMLSLNASIFRRDLLARLLNPGKDINYECGYPNTITIDDYKNMWDREGLASRVTELMPDESWAMEPKVYEDEKTEETEFEKAWDELNKERNLLHYLHRIDVMSGIGRFGILLMGLDDGKELSKPVDGINDKTGEATGKNKHQLMYLKPFDEKAVEVKLKETDVSSPRYSFPVTYSIEFEGNLGQSTSIKKEVHWTRVLHVADNRWSSEVNGTPRMKTVFNRLLDARKIVSGSGEMFWKGAFPGYSFETKEGMEDVEIDSDQLREEFKSYADGLQRYLALTGVTAKSLAPQVADPKPHLEAQVRYIALTLGIPYRIFLGTEEAKLASFTDKETWNKRVKRRQDNYLTPLLLRPFVDRLIAYGALPEPKEYFVDWPDLSTPSDKDKSEVARNQTEALAKYVGADVHMVFPPKEYFMEIFELEEDKAEAIVKAAEIWTADHPPEPEVIEVPAGQQPQPKPTTKTKKKVKKKVKAKKNVR